MKNFKVLDILQPYCLYDLNLKNRVVLSAMTRTRASDDGVPNALMREYYLQRATAGLIITEATAISSAAYSRVGMPGLESDKHVQGWRDVVVALHTANTPIFVQLWHCGRVSHSSMQPGGVRPLAPSSVGILEESIHTRLGVRRFERPRRASHSELVQIAEGYRCAAERARAAGFDGVEVSAAFGNLLDQFLQSVSNHRRDRYGGSVDRRLRFPLEIIDVVSKVFPPHRVAVRIAPNCPTNGMGSLDSRETFLQFAKQLDARGLAYLHVTGGYACGHHGLGAPLMVRDFRRVYSGVLMCSGGYSRESAAQIITEGTAELVAFGRPFISNPDLVGRFAAGCDLNPAANEAAYYGRGAQGYLDFAPRS